jgi:hypothetical protein
MSWLKILQVVITVGRVLWPLLEPLIFSQTRDQLGRPIRQRRWLFRPWGRRRR